LFFLKIAKISITIKGENKMKNFYEWLENTQEQQPANVDPNQEINSAVQQLGIQFLDTTKSL